MAVTLLSSSDVVQQVHQSFGLDTTSSNLAPEALAGLLRRAASFQCPTTSRRLVREVARVVQGLPCAVESLEDELAEIVDALVACGDLYEVASDDQTSGGSSRQLRLGPPRFVRRSEQSCLLLGIRPEGVDLVNEEADCTVEHRAHLRIVRVSSGCPTPIDELMEAQGIWEVEMNQWLQAPRAATPEEVVHEYDQRLDVAPRSSDISNVLIADRPQVTFYRGRWRVPAVSDHGRFVARRPQRFGAAVWCYLELEGGIVVRVIDLPVLEAWRRGADEAWRLLAANDAVAGMPQQARVIATGSDECRLELYSPVPSWIQRRLDITGRPIPRHPGSLVSYSVPLGQIDDERAFVAEMMWVDFH